MAVALILESVTGSKPGGEHVAVEPHLDAQRLGATRQRGHAPLWRAAIAQAVEPWLLGGRKVVAPQPAPAGETGPRNLQPRLLRRPAPPIGLEEQDPARASFGALDGAPVHRSHAGQRQVEPTQAVVLNARISHPLPRNGFVEAGVGDDHHVAGGEAALEDLRHPVLGDQMDRYGAGLPPP